MITIFGYIWTTDSVRHSHLNNNRTIIIFMVSPYHKKYAIKSSWAFSWTKMHYRRLGYYDFMMIWQEYYFQRNRIKILKATCPLLLNEKFQYILNEVNQDSTNTILNLLNWLIFFDVNICLFHSDTVVIYIICQRYVDILSI
jgi:hypothetical protein